MNVLTGLSGSAASPHWSNDHNKSISESVKSLRGLGVGGGSDFSGVLVMFPSVNFWSRDQREPQYWLKLAPRGIRR